MNVSSRKFQAEQNAILYPITPSDFFSKVKFGNTIGLKGRDFLRTLLCKFPSGSEPVVLDYGCGNALVTIDLFPAASKIYGFDISLDCINFAQSNCQLAQIPFVGTSIPSELPKYSIDYAVLLALFEILSNEQMTEVLRTVRTSLKDNGKLLCTFHPVRRLSALHFPVFVKNSLKLNFNLKAAISARLGYSASSRTLKETALLVEKAGFRILETGGYNPYFLNEKFLNFPGIKQSLRYKMFYSTRSNLLAHWMVSQYLVAEKV